MVGTVLKNLDSILEMDFIRLDDQKHAQNKYNAVAATKILPSEVHSLKNQAKGAESSMKGQLK